MASYQQQMPFMDMPFFGSHLTGGANGMLLAQNLMQSAKVLFGEDVLQRLSYCLEDHLARATNETGPKGAESKKDEPQPSTSSASQAQPEAGPSTSHPFNSFGGLMQHIDQVLSKEFSGEQKEKDSVPTPTNTTNDQVVPSEEQEFKVQLKASGFQPEDIRVKVKDGYVTVQALRETQDQENGTTSTQKLNKSVKLPSNVNPDKVTCEMSQDGLLTFRAKLPEVAKPLLHERIIAIKQDDAIKPE